MDERQMQRARLWIDASGSVYRDGEPCACSDNGYGYLKCRAGNHTFKVHQLAAEQFFGGGDPSLWPRLATFFQGVQWEVAHKDHNKKNNCRENLAYVPHSFNMIHSSDCPLIQKIRRRERDRGKRADRRARLSKLNACGRSWCRAAVRIMAVVHGRSGGNKAQASGVFVRPSAKLEEHQIEEILSRFKDGEAKRSLSRRFGVSATQVGRIVSGKHWSRRVTNA